MDENELLAAVAMRLEDAGHYAEVHTLQVTHNNSGVPWVEEKRGLMVDHAHVQVHFGRRRTPGRWWLQVAGPQRYTVVWVCKGAGDQLAITRLAEAILKNLPAYIRTQQEREQEEAVATSVHEARDKAVAMGIAAKAATDHPGPRVIFYLRCTALAVMQEEQEVTDELLEAWLALQESVEAQVNEFRRRFVTTKPY